MNRIRVLAGLATAAALLAPATARAATAVAPPAVDPLATCTAGDFSQPLLSLKDKSYYTLAPSGAFDSDTTNG